MNSKTWTRFIAVVLFAVLTIPVQLAAQQHIRYTVTDLGTLGGPIGYGSIDGDGAQLLNNAGAVVSFADTPLPDPNAHISVTTRIAIRGTPFSGRTA